jgi:hypothetical protein
LKVCNFKEKEKTVFTEITEQKMVGYKGEKDIKIKKGRE